MSATASIFSAWREATASTFDHLLALAVVLLLPSGLLGWIGGVGRAVGRTTAGHTGWRATKGGALRVDVDASGCGYGFKPRYFPALLLGRGGGAGWRRAAVVRDLGRLRPARLREGRCRQLRALRQPLRG